MTPLTPLHVAAHQKLHFVDVVSDIILLKAMSSAVRKDFILYISSLSSRLSICQFVRPRVEKVMV